MAEDHREFPVGETDVRRHRGRSGLVDRGIGRDPAQQVFALQMQDHTITGTDPRGHEAAGQTVRRDVPLAERDGLRGAEIDVGDLRARLRRRPSELIDQQSHPAVRLLAEAGIGET